jgi:hypothetical protein
MLSLIRLAGSPFEVGRSLGRFGEQAAHTYLVPSAAWASVMAWRGTDTAKAMAGQVQAGFPLIWEELAGLADGLQLPLDDVFLWNCRGDVWAMAPDGCTTVQWPGAGELRISHNEDGDPGFGGLCAIAQIDIAGGARFASFVYPASIPGHAFAVNDAGLAMTVNNLRSRRVGAGVPRMVLTRALLNQSSLADALALLRGTSRAGGFHLSLAQAGQAELLSVEFNSFGVSAMAMRRPAIHANHALHDSMAGFPQIITDSSLRRQGRGEALLPAESASLPHGQAGPADPLHILADQGDARFPIYRNAPDDSDAENTLATADLFIRPDGVAWQVYERPGHAAVCRLFNGQFC